MVSNLQLNPGIYATAATAVLALVNNNTDIVADFREKSLRHTAVNTDAAVVFDALPGQVFPAHVTSSDAGILAGQEAVNGQLSQPEQSTRWVRDAQRMRIHVALDQPLDKPLPTGARATVQLYNSEGPFARTFAGLQIHPGELVALCLLIPSAHVFTPHGNIVYTANDFRQTVRIAVAGTIALSISTFYDVQYGVFFVVYPLMLMSLVPMFNLHVARQFIFSAAVNCVEMVLIVGYLSQWPVIMTLGGVCPVRDAFPLYEPGTAVPVGINGGGVPEHDAQLYELSHQQLAHPDVLQYGSLRDGRGAERAAALPDPGRRTAQAAAAD